MEASRNPLKVGGEYNIHTSDGHNEWRIRSLDCQAGALRVPLFIGSGWAKWAIRFGGRVLPRSWCCE